MNISETCIRRPVMTTLITASLIVFGAFAYRLLPVAALPAVDSRPSRSPRRCRARAPRPWRPRSPSPIERQFSTIAGISSMTSSSSLGQTQITIQFDLNRNIDGAALDVQTALAVAARRLPVEMTTPPFFRKVNPGDFPVLYHQPDLADTCRCRRSTNTAETVLAQQISQLPGVAQVLVYGAQKFAVRVQVDPVAAAARNISLDDIRTVVAKANSNAPVGTLHGPSSRRDAARHRRDARTPPTTATSWSPSATARRSSSTKSRDVIDSVENDKIASWFNNDRAIVLAIQRQPDANTVEVVDLVRGQAAGSSARRCRPSIQHGAAARPLDLDPRRRSTTCRKRWRSRSALVIMVIFLFLRSVSATIIPALAVPISLIGTCAAMYAFGFSINNMTLLALTLSVGFVVDDAIVMLENIVRHIEGGMRPFEAALKGAREIGFTIVSITFSLIAVFIPVLLMGGMVGRVFREFAVTIAVAIIVSGFVSLTLTPMLCARVLRGHHDGEREAEFRAARVRAHVREHGCGPTNGRSTGCSPTSRSC